MRRALAFFAFFCACVPAAAQVVLDAQSSVTDLITSGANTTTLAHTTTAAENRILLVSVHLNIRPETDTVVTGATYGGQALALLSSISDAGDDTRTEVWYRLAPPSGANNVVVTYGGLGPGDTIEALVGVTTFSGVNQTVPLGSAFSGMGSPAGNILFGTAASDAVIDFLTARESVTVTPNPAQTAGYNTSTGGTNDDLQGASSRRAGAAGFTIMAWTLSANRRWSDVAVRLQAARADVAVTKTATDPGPDGTFAEGEPLTYTITVTNNGPSAATNVVVTDPLPAGFTFGSVSPGGPVCVEASGTVTCTYGAIQPGSSNVITIDGTITTNTTQLVNTASATRNEIDANAANDSASVTVFVVAPTVVHMLDAGAEQDGQGNVLISWTTSFEAENLGFNVLRNGQRINEQLIPGSALFARGGQLGAGRGYRWRDKVSPGELPHYVIEDVDLHGVRTTHGPVMPLLVAELPNDMRTATHAQPEPAGGVFVSPRGLGAPRRPSHRGNATRQWALASQAAVKLMVTEEGWYRVPFPALAAAGFTPGKELALFAEGIEQPIQVTRDAIEFYGQGIDTPSTGARTYWLVNENGRKRIRRDQPRKGAFTATRTPFTVERIERRVFFTALTNNGDGENFFGPVINATPATQELQVENLDRTGDAASLEIVLQGAGTGAHRVEVTVNGQNAGIVKFGGMSRHVAAIPVPLSMLAPGPNTIALTAVNGDLDVSVLEALRLTYPHTLVADGDALKVSVRGSSAITAGGFGSPVRAFDVTDPSDPIELDVESRNGAVTVVAPPGGTRSVLLIGESRIAAPAQVVADRPSSWHAKTNAAGLVIVAARPFIPAAAPLKARRDGEGIATTIVDVEDVADEFGFGERSPKAIRDFLLRTRAWAQPPRYVLLLGDASLDPRNYLGLGSFDFVPTKLVATLQMKTASDEWLVEGIPALSIGRLPARTAGEAEAMTGKIAGWDPSGSDQVRFVADPSSTFDFAGAAASLAALVPAPLVASTEPRAGSASFDSLLLTYFGHGSVDLWSAGRFRGGNAASLRNTRLPVVVSLTCLNGYFHDVSFSSLAEALMSNPAGGAVAVWASSTLTPPAPQLEMAAELLRQLFAGARLGDAVRKAKSATADEDARRSWILFGDPSLELTQP